MEKKIKELNEILKKAAKAYYIDGKEIMSNFEYDKLYDELLELETQTGIILPDSVTQNVGYTVLDSFEKVTHSKPMLSLDKTKDREVLKDWLGDKKGVLSLKLDGLTIVLTYEGGKLVDAVTRGNGSVGERVLHTISKCKSVPNRISYKDKLIIRCETLISYKEFERINSLLDIDSQYKNPRNLTSGTVRQLDSSIMKERNVEVVPFTLVEGGPDTNSYNEQLDWLDELGFNTVLRKTVTSENILDNISEFEKTVKSYKYPSDGLVLFYDDIAYGLSLGNTSKFPRNGIAFKWADETAETILREIEWSASRTGLLNPVAIFDSVELEGTTVSRASIHNLSMIESLGLNIGDTIEVYKANMIIPQIAENLTKSLRKIEDIIPDTCPVCGKNVKIQESDGTKVLKCMNDDCPAKKIGMFEHFAARDAANIVGLSGSTIEKLINAGIIKELKDLYYLSNHEQEIVNMEGFGKKSYDKLVKAIESSKDIDPDKFLYALGITNVGRSVSKDIMKMCEGNFDKIFEKDTDDFLAVEGVGEMIANNLSKALKTRKDEIEELMKEFRFSMNHASSGNNDEKLKDMVFVVTGKVFHYKNRDELKTVIESLGGKVAGSVSSKTNYLINNDATSSSGKNKKAKELGVKIITEEEFMKMIED